MRAKRENASTTVRVVTAAICLSIVILLASIHGTHSTSADPCAGRSPQVCEAQQAIDRQHAIENERAEGDQR